MSGEYASVGTQTSGVTDRAYAAPQGGLIVYGLVAHGGRREALS
jgi:hypothetical protein